MNTVPVSIKQKVTLASTHSCRRDLTLPETVKEEMQATKELWGKTDGRTYKHYVQSYSLLFFHTGDFQKCQTGTKKSSKSVDSVTVTINNTTTYSYKGMERA